MVIRNIAIAASLLVFSAFPAIAQQSAPSVGPDFVTIANLSDQAPVTLVVKVKKTAELKPERAPGLAAGWARLYVEADVLALIRGQNGIAQSIRYLVDVPRDNKGRAPKLKKQQFILFARQQASRPGEVQLIGPNAQIPWSPEAEARVRRMITEMVSADAPPKITGIREALHVRGNLQGEGETQVFLATANGDPVSITVLRRPGLAPRWAVSLTEIVDEAAAPPARNTLLWYRLACFLPDQIPQRALVSNTPSDNTLAMRDYNYVREELGPCSTAL